MGVLVGMGGLSSQAYHPYMGSWLSLQYVSAGRRRHMLSRQIGRELPGCPRVGIGHCRIKRLPILMRTRSLPGRHAYMSVL